MTTTFSSGFSSGFLKTNGAAAIIAKDVARIVFGEKASIVAFVAAYTWPPGVPSKRDFLLVMRNGTTSKVRLNKGKWPSFPPEPGDSYFHNGVAIVLDEDGVWA